MGSKMPKVPAILADIDGVLVRGNKAIPGTSDTIKLLKTPLNQINSDIFTTNSKLPLLLITNGGGMKQVEKS
jgi:ribonucleotide monophosphatase NagD (HAD superfamily)